MRTLNKKTWPYTVEFNDIHTLDKAVVWSEEMFPGKDRWCYVGLGCLHFRDEADAAFCELKWA